MATIEVVRFPGAERLRLINDILVVSPEASIGDIQKWLEELEALEEEITTAFTPKAMVENYKIPQCFESQAKSLKVGLYFIYNGYKIRKVTENLCVVEVNE